VRLAGSAGDRSGAVAGAWARMRRGWPAAARPVAAGWGRGDLEASSLATAWQRRAHGATRRARRGDKDVIDAS